MFRITIITLIVCEFIGLILLGVGIGLIFVVKDRIKSYAEQESVIESKSTAYELWKNDSSLDFNVKFHLYDVKNAYEILKGEKPILEEKGPYTYRLIRQKSHHSFRSNGTKLFYRLDKYFVFDRNLSIGSDEDKVVSVNFPILAAASQLEPLSKLIHDRVRELLSYYNNSLFKTLTVKEVLFGWDEPFLKNISNLTEHFLKIDVIKDSYNLFPGRLMNDSNNYTIFTGKDDVQDVRIIAKLNGNSSLSYWNDDFANRINGSEGLGWHPLYGDQSEKLTYFTTDLCRSLDVAFEREMTDRNISFRRYVIPYEALESGKKNSANLGFCTSHCLDDGLLDVSKCREAPVIISWPHFYLGDEKYVECCDLEPKNKELHETYVNVEPYTGLVLDAAFRTQLNVHISNYSSYEETDNITSIVFPIVWYEEIAKLSDDNAATFVAEILTPICGGEAVIYVWIGFGVVTPGVVFIAAALCYLLCTIRDQHAQKKNYVTISE